MVIHVQVSSFSKQNNLATKEEISAGACAARWWTKAVKNPKFDNGINSIESMADRLTHSLVAINNKLSQENLDAFESLLAVRIDTQLITDYKRSIQLITDYEPSYILLAAAIDAGLPTTQMKWPWLIEMNITENSIHVKYGYNNQSELIWQS